MRRLVHFLVAGAAALALGACATMTVSSHIEPAVDLKHYYTYDWSARDALPEADTRLDRDPTFHDYVQGAVEKQLTLRGYERASAARPADLLIHYHATVDTRIDVKRAYHDHGSCYGAECAQVREYEAGTLVIDVLDARTKEVVWRGWARDSAEGVIDDRDRLHKMIDVAVRRIFERFQESALTGER